MSSLQHIPWRLLRYFAWRNESEASFSRGIVRDLPRHAIPPGGVYDATDYLFDRPGVAYKRGGSGFQSSELTDEVQIIAVAAPEYPGDPRVVVVATDGDDSRLYDVTGSSAATAVSLTAVPTENPPLYLDRLILTDGFGDSAVQKAFLSGSDVDVADLGGSPPNAHCSCVHLGYLVLANSDDNPNRFWFNPSGIPANVDIEDPWNLDTGFLEVNEPITGLASISGVLLVFSRGKVWRVLGSVAPGLKDEDMSVQLISESAGCIDARSIVQMGSLVFFANESGVYYTNGVGATSITSKEDAAGIAALWAEAVAGYSPSLGSVVCAGVWLNQHLFVTVRHSDDDPQEGARYQFLYHAQTGAWTTLADGVTADMYATRFAPDGEIYAACGDTADPPRLLTLSGLFAPAEANGSDANGEAVEPTLTLRPFAASPDLKAYGHGHVTYRLQSDDTPAAVKRQRFEAFADSEALTVKIEQTGASAVTEIISVEIELRPYDAESEIDA